MKKTKTKVAAIVLGAALSVTTLACGLMLNNPAAFSYTLI